MFFHTIVLFFIAATTAYSTSLDYDDPYKLPGNLKPTLYDLNIVPNWESSSFNAVVKIEFDVLQETDSIVLNLDKKYIVMPSLKVCVRTKEGEKVKVIDLKERYDIVEFILNQPLPRQTGVIINFHYKGLIATNISERTGEGFYRVNNSTRSSLMTQFEVTSARRVFPCFDEPKYRAKFDFRIARPRKFKSLFNTPLKSTKAYWPKPGWVVDTFKRTEPIPIYTLAFVVTDMASISDGNRVRVFAPSNRIHEAKYALSVAEPLLQAMADYTGVPDQLDKLDMVVDLAKSWVAMENWGLNTYGYEYLLINNSNKMEKHQTMMVVAHEVAHQWFGNLVTMESWDYRWLKEAFASYFQNTLPIKVQQDELTESSIYAMNSAQTPWDDLPLTLHLQNLTLEHYTPSFYLKGYQVLRMTENFLTTPVWKNGIHNYLTENMYGVTTPQNLYSAFQKAVNEAGLSSVIDIEEILHGWFTNPGYPLITVTLETFNPDTQIAEYRIEQVPFNKTRDDNTEWIVPLTYTTEETQQFDPSKVNRHWLRPSDPSTSRLYVHYAGITSPGWVLFNIDMIGLYRVNYDQDNWRKLSQQLRQDVTVIPAVSRAKILEDAINLWKYDRLSFEVVQGLAESLVLDTAPEPWTTFMGGLMILGNSPKEDLLKYKEMVQRLMQQVAPILVKDLEEAASTVRDTFMISLIRDTICYLDVKPAGSDLKEAMCSLCQKYCNSNVQIY